MNFQSILDSNPQDILFACWDSLQFFPIINHVIRIEYNGVLRFEERFRNGKKCQHFEIYHLSEACISELKDILLVYKDDIKLLDTEIYCEVFDCTPYGFVFDGKPIEADGICTHNAPPPADMTPAWQQEVLVLEIFDKCRTILQKNGIDISLIPFKFQSSSELK